MTTSGTRARNGVDLIMTETHTQRTIRVITSPYLWTGMAIVSLLLYTGTVVAEASPSYFAGWILGGLAVKIVESCFARIPTELT